MASKRRADVDNVDRFRLERTLGGPELVGAVLVSVDCLIGDRRSEEEEQAGFEVAGDQRRRGLDREREARVGG